MRSRRARLLLTFALTGLLALPPASAGAVPSELQQELEDAEARLAELDTAASSAVEDADEAQARLVEAEQRLAGLSARVEELSAAVEAGQRQVDRYVAALYKRGPATTLEAALSSTGPAEAGRGLVQLRRVTEHRNLQVASLSADRDELERSQRELAAARDAAAAERTRLEAEQARVVALLEDQRDEVASLRDRIAEIERQEREARERAAREEAARQAAAREAAAAPAASPATPAPAPTATPAPAPPPAGSGAATAVRTALAQVGKPYRWGGSGPDVYDCSGLTSYAWRAGGKTLPHSSRMQFAVTTPISRSQLRPGDLIFFGSPIHHVAMYIGNGTVVEAPYSGTTVRINSRALSRSDITGYRRP